MNAQQFSDEKKNIIADIDWFDDRIEKMMKRQLKETSKRTNQVRQENFKTYVDTISKGNKKIEPTFRTREVLSPTDDDQHKVVPGLMAIGEAACVSVHGANRLGTNSLLDIVVFGRAAAMRTEDTLKKNQKHSSIDKDATDKIIDRLDKVRYSKGDTSVGEVRSAMQNAMQ